MGEHSEYFGGTVEKIGSANDLLDYARSRSSEAKIKLIRKIAADLKTSLRLKDINVEGNIDTLVSSIKKTW